MISRSLSGPDGRSELAGLYLRVAETLERSARPAEQHATRNRSNGRPDGAAVELERASRAARRLGGPRARCANALSARLTWRSAGSVLSPAQQRVLLTSRSTGDRGRKCGAGAAPGSLSARCRSPLEMSGG